MRAINADAPRTDEERAAVAEFEAQLPLALRMRAHEARLAAQADRLCDFTAPTAWRLDEARVALMRRVFAERNGRLDLPADVHPFVDPATGRAVPLLSSWDEAIGLRLWAGRWTEAENDAAIARGRAVGELARWLRRLVAWGNRVAGGVVTFVRAFGSLRRTP